MSLNCGKTRFDAEAIIGVKTKEGGMNISAFFVNLQGIP
jgi:hypothetical protein